MAEDLATFLDNDLIQIDEQTQRIRTSLQQAALLLKRSFEVVPAIEKYDGGHFGWHYSWFSKPEPSPTHPTNASISTQAMCCSSVGALLEINSRRSFLRPHLMEALSKCRQDVLDFIPKYFGWFPTCLAKRKEDEKAELWSSGTFGADDVFTASWLVQILPPTIDAFRKLVSFLRVPDPEKRERDSDKKGGAKIDVDVDITLFKKKENEAGPHPLPLLKLVRALQKVHKESPALIAEAELREFKSKAANWFERNLHRQISFHQSTDFRHDAAELIFCLAGSIETDAIPIQDEVIHQALEVVHDAQRRSVYWRPYRPMLSTQQGHVLLPLSIEIAAALLDVLERTDQFAQHHGALSKYTDWLLNQKLYEEGKDSSDAAVDKQGDGAAHAGWHSENAYESSYIHVWNTALISVFLARYWEALSQNATRKVLALSRFSVRRPQRLLENIVDFNRDLSGYSLKELKQDFIDHSKHYSLLLYGPPGTSKTTISEAIACTKATRAEATIKTRGKAATRLWPLVYLSPSDFLTHGEAGVEERAKLIFRALEATEDVVIYFDEIDRMLLDRESDAYNRQGEVFQFMTPGMLTKLNDLRKRRHSIFIIGTNFADRIDPAIKRLGRIDARMLCVPYDLEGRKELLRQLVNDKVSERFDMEPKDLPDLDGEDEKNVTTLARNSLYTFTRNSRNAWRKRPKTPPTRPTARSSEVRCSRISPVRLPRWHRRLAPKPTKKESRKRNQRRVKLRGSKSRSTSISPFS